MEKSYRRIEDLIVTQQPLHLPGLDVAGPRPATSVCHVLVSDSGKARSRSSLDDTFLIINNGN